LQGALPTILKVCRPPRRDLVKVGCAVIRILCGSDAYAQKSPQSDSVTSPLVSACRTRGASLVRGRPTRGFARWRRGWKSRYSRRGFGSDVRQRRIVCCTRQSTIAECPRCSAIPVQRSPIPHLREFWLRFPRWPFCLAVFLSAPLL